MFWYIIFIKMKCDFKDFSGNQNISREKNKKKQKKY